MATMFGGEFLTILYEYTNIHYTSCRLEFSSEGVQIGGIGSAYGVLGTWTTADHDFGDPVGKFIQLCYMFFKGLNEHVRTILDEKGTSYIDVTPLPVMTQ